MYIWLDFMISDGYIVMKHPAEDSIFGLTPLLR